MLTIQYGAVLLSKFKTISVNHLNNNYKILVTGAAGFIGYHLVMLLIRNQYDVVGIDNLNNYYDVNLKYNRLRDCGIEYSYHTQIKSSSSKYPNPKCLLDRIYN